MKKKYLLLMMLSTIGLVSVAQQPPLSRIEINNVNATILGSGSCFTPQYQWEGEPKSCPTWSVPAGTTKETIYQHSLWFGGLDSDDSLHFAGLRFGQVSGNPKGDYGMGPLKTTDGTTNLYTAMKYHYIWNLTRDEIEQFIANHNNAGYLIPEDILTWPAHGEEGYAENFAPFVDVNHDGKYNPADGDYPDIKGDQCLFFIFNDNTGPHLETGGGALGLEVHAMVYAFNAPNDEALNNTVFVNYKFFNRSANDYHNTYIGLWTDWDLGYARDDYVGCDVQRNSCFAYNGMLIDGSGEWEAYGDNPPVQVLTVLNGPDGLGMTGFMYHNNSAVTNGDPTYADEYYLYLKGFWRDGQHMLYGGNAYSGENVVGPECNYMFPGDTDPNNIGTGGIAPNGGYNTNGKYWTEEECGNAPDDRRGLASIGSFSFPSGSMKELDYAMITVWKNNSMSAFERKGEFIDHIKSLFNNGLAK